MSYKTSKKEISFWNQHLIAGTIGNAIRTDRERAKEFFGALPSLRLDEAELRQIAFARKLLALSDAEVQTKIDQINGEIGPEMDDWVRANPDIPLEEKDAIVRELRVGSAAYRLLASRAREFIRLKTGEEEED